MLTKPVFISPKEKFLDAACRVICEVSTTGAAAPGSASPFLETCLDLRANLLVLPTSRASRLLHEKLLRTAESLGKALLPPRIVSLGELPESLYHHDLPLAGDLERLLAWTYALKKLPVDQLRTLLPQPPAEDDFSKWYALAEDLEQVYVEISAAMLDFEKARRLLEERLLDFPDSARWQTIDTAWRVFQEQLALWGVSDKHSLRLRKVEEVASLTGENTSFERIWLLATVDLSPLMESYCDRSAIPVTPIIYAEESDAELFGDSGALNQELWGKRPIFVDDGDICVVNSSVDQALSAYRELERLSLLTPMSDLSVGILDSSVTEHLTELLKAIGTQTRLSQGVPFNKTPLWQLLHCLSSFLKDGSIKSLQSLVRHPHFERWVGQKLGLKGSLLAELDRLSAYHLPTYVECVNELDSSLISGELTSLCNFVISLRQRYGQLRLTLDGWSREFALLFIELYESFSTSEESSAEELDALSHLRECLVEISNLVVPIDQLWTVSDFVTLLSKLLGKRSIAEEALGGALQLSGWLELVLDESRHCVVVGFNEGLAPESITAHPFLPDSARRVLGIRHDGHRFARDAWTLDTLVQSKASVKLILGNVNSRGEKLLPSRLLFQTDAKSVALRVKRVFSDTASSFPMLLYLSSEVITDTVYPPLAVRHSVASMSISAFKHWLESPYLFYLRNVLRLEVLDDSPRELIPSVFGTLAHDVLATLTELGDQQQANEVAVRDLWLDSLHEMSRKMFGSRPLAAVRLQIEMLRARLVEAAKAQAAWAGEGWRVQEVESVIDSDKVELFLLDGLTMRLRGRIDRIDYNSRTNQHCVIDYKTSDRALLPESAHLSKDGTWKDLQLPLYRYAVTELNPKSHKLCAYFNLPKEVSDIGIRQWDMSVEVYDEAIKEACRIALDVSRANYAETSDAKPCSGDDLPDSPFSSFLS